MYANFKFTELFGIKAQAEPPCDNLPGVPKIELCLDFEYSSLQVKDDSTKQRRIYVIK